MPVQIVTVMSGIWISQVNNSRLKASAFLLSGSFSRSVAILTARLRSSGVEGPRFCATVVVAEKAQTTTRAIISNLPVITPNPLKSLNSNRPQFSVLFNQLAQRLIRIVIKQASPFFSRRLRQQLFFRLQCFGGEKIVAHYPCVRHMRLHGN